MLTVQKFIDKLQALPNKDLPLLVKEKHNFVFPWSITTELPPEDKDEKAWFDATVKELGKKYAKGFVLIMVE